MGKQLCPDEELFSATPSAVGASGETDFSFSEEVDAGAGDSIDFDFSEGAGADGVSFDGADADLDFDLSSDDLGVDDQVDQGLDFDISEAEEATLAAADEDLYEGSTMETPTMESPIQPPSDDVASTMETPTMESPIQPPSDDAASTIETPTMESPIQPPSDDAASTMETPTVESEALEQTMESPIESPDDADSFGVDQTAEIELDDLGLDLSDLEEAGSLDESAEIASADDSELGAGINLAAETLQVEVDGLDAFDEDTQAHKVTEDDLRFDDELPAIVDVEATGEMPSLGETAHQPVVEETVEQPAIGGAGDTAEQPGLAAVGAVAAESVFEPGDSSAEVDFEVGDAFAEKDQTAGVVPATVANGATMTEVGTKLDLARAYIDMGDPDGARSILNEVLEEAIDEQRQEAQKLLEDLED